MASAEEGVPPKAASELASMKLRELILHAAELGISEAELDVAEDQADHKGAVIDLITAKTAVADPQSKLIASLREELSNMKLTGLVMRAQKSGVSEEQLDAAEDADDFKSAVTELIIAKETSDAQVSEDADPIEVLRAELSAMKLTQQLIRAAAAGATEGEIEAAEDADDFNTAMTELIIAKETSEAQDAEEGEGPSGLLRAGRFLFFVLASETVLRAATD
jgi:DNA-binding transcriptional regulator YhcF (GntR family)